MRLFLSVFLLPGMVCASAGAQEPPVPSTIKVETDLVTLTATVLDRGDRPIVDLEKGDFLLYEDGVAQDIAVFQKEDVPVSLGILFDTSGSMVDKIDEVKDALQATVMRWLRPSAHCERAVPQHCTRRSLRDRSMCNMDSTKREP